MPLVWGPLVDVRGGACSVPTGLSYLPQSLTYSPSSLADEFPCLDPSGLTGVEILLECLPQLAPARSFTGFWKLREIWIERSQQMSNVKADEYLNH